MNSIQMIRRHFLRSLIGLPLLGAAPAIPKPESFVLPAHIAAAKPRELRLHVHAVDADSVERLFAKNGHLLGKALTDGRKRS